MLSDPGAGARGSAAVVLLVVIAVPLYCAVAVRCFLLYRRRHWVVWLSIPTAEVLLADVLLAEATSSWRWARTGAHWHLTWWLWHVLMVLAFGYVGYSAYVTYRRQGATWGLFGAVGTGATLSAVRAEYGSALEQLVAAVAKHATAGSGVAVLSVPGVPLRRFRALHTTYAVLRRRRQQPYPRRRATSTIRTGRPRGS